MAYGEVFIISWVIRIGEMKIHFGIFGQYTEVRLLPGNIKVSVMVVFNEGFFLYLRQPGKTKLNLQKIKEAG
jgi:hypothetical protein